MKSPKSILIALLLIVMVVIVLQNTEAVETRLLFASISMPRALLLFITLCAGIVIGLLWRGKLSKPGSDD